MSWRAENICILNFNSEVIQPQFSFLPPESWPWPADVVDPVSFFILYFSSYLYICPLVSFAAPMVHIEQRESYTSVSSRRELPNCTSPTKKSNTAPTSPRRVLRKFSIIQQLLHARFSGFPNLDFSPSSLRHRRFGSTLSTDYILCLDLVATIFHHLLCSTSLFNLWLGQTWQSAHNDTFSRLSTTTTSWKRFPTLWKCWFGYSFRLTFLPFLVSSI